MNTVTHLSTQREVVAQQDNPKKYNPKDVSGKAFEGQLRNLQSKVADFSAQMESVAGGVCGHKQKENLGKVIRKFAKSVDKEMTTVSAAVSNAESEYISSRIRHSAANQAVDDVVASSIGLSLFLKDIEALSDKSEGT